VLQRYLLPPSGLITLMMEAENTSETLVNFYQTTWRYNPEYSHVHTHCHENLKSYTDIHLKYKFKATLIPNK
jgi:hypothetical protein